MNQTHPYQDIIKIEKVKEQILKAAREKKKKKSYSGTPIRLSVDFSAESVKSRKKQNIDEVLEKQNLQSSMFYSVKLLFTIEREIKNFSDKQKI